jgi:protein-disulfide isomerase
MPTSKGSVAKPVKIEHVHENKSITPQTEVDKGGFMKDKLVPVLVVLVIISAFAVGLLYGKVSVYEKGGAAVKTAAVNNQADDTAQAPSQPTPGPISDSQWQELVTSKLGQVEGDKNAKVTVVEFTDYQCPFCSQYYKDAYIKIVADYVKSGKVKYMLFDLPLPFHQNAKPAALAARCAGEQDKYWEMHEQLFTNQEAWSTGDPKEKFITYAKTIGLNEPKFTTCYTEGKYSKDVDDSLALAQKVGANGTPTFYVNGTQLVGAQPYSEFQKALDGAIK